MTPTPGQLWKWLIAVAVLVVAGLLWVSWRFGLFPLVSGTVTSPSEQMPQPTQEQTIDSLSAPRVPESSPAPVFESLTPAPAPVAEASDNAAGSPTVDQSVLDSLSAPK